jgi:hypothetical protein
MPQPQRRQQLQIPLLTEQPRTTTTTEAREYIVTYLCQEAFNLVEQILFVPLIIFF